MNQTNNTSVSDELTLNNHLMHPGGDSAPGDPNAAVHLFDNEPVLEDV